ncbi:MAG: hypothetical protein KKB20_18425, partial [Proteobacteria bacterium]|nr:hypothetical protein [Pseudomonadota bacterium]
MSSRIITSVLLLLALCCSAAVPAQAREASTRRPGDEPRLVMFIPRPDPFWESNVRYARAAARNLGVNLDVVDFQDDSAVLLGNVERVCQEGADAIIFQSFAATGEKVL